jgi:hypothetical protein
LLYLYGLLPLDAGVAPPERGVLDVAVTPIDAGDVRAWVSELPEAFSLNAKAVAVHLQVLQTALAAGTTPLPARMGQRFRTADDLRHAIADQRTGIATSLARVRGSGEMVVQLRSLEAPGHVLLPSTKSGPGRAYLERLQHREGRAGELGRRMAALRESIQTQIGGLILADDLGAPALEPRPTITLAHLVSLRTVSEYRRRLGELLQRSIEPDEWAWGIQGPIPPFSFARWDSSAGVPRD